MKLMTQTLAQTLPALYETEGQGIDAMARVKWFSPDGQWTWYLTEYNAANGMCFGLIDGFERELGYFSQKEIEAVRGPLGLPVERDCHFHPTTLRELMAQD